MTFANANFKTRNYECRNIVACVCDVKPVGMPQKWVECDADTIHELDMLEVCHDANGKRVELFGYM